MKLRIAIVVALLVASALAAQTQPEVSYADDFQSYGTQKNPPGWVDTSIGSSKPIAGGLFKTWPDPLQSSNVVFGTKQSSGNPDGNNPRIGTFSTYTSKSFAGRGRFEYRGRFIRTNADSRIGFTFFSSYPESDQYYLIGLWKQAAGSALTMQFFSFGAGAPTGTTDSGVTPEPNKWYRFAIQADDVDGATFIRARFWLEGTPEPPSFSINAKDSTALRLTAGRIGIWAAVKGDAYVDDLSAKSPVDHTAPVIKFVDAPAAKTLDPAVLALYDKPAVIDVVVTDDLSTVTVTTKLDGVVWTPTTPISVDGPHTITVHAVDGPGNAAGATLNLLVDQIDPAVTILIDGAPFVAGAVFDDDVAITATITDATTARVTAASVDGVAVTLPAHVAEDKLHTVTVTAVDQVGNEGSSTAAFYVDTKAPLITILANAVELPDNLFFHDDVTLTWTVDDLTRDIVTATLDGQSINSGTLVSAAGAHTVVVTATDKAGHSTTVTRHFIIDTTKPEVHIFANAKAFNPGSTFGEAVTFTVDVKDDTPTTAPVAKIDGNAYVLGTAVAAEGQHTFAVTVSNAAGLTTDLGPFAFTVDLHDPVVTLTESGAAFQNGMKFTRDVVPVVAATDNFTASPALELFVDGMKYPLATPIASESADHTISATATDAGGRTATIGPFHFILDKTKPVVTIAFGEGDLFAHPVTVKVTVVDITRVTLAATRNGAPLDFGTGVAQQDGSVVFTAAPIAADGTYDISVVATDDVGLASDAVTAHFTIDLTPPALTFTAPVQNGVVANPAILVQGTSDDAVSVIVDDRDATVDATAKTFFINDVALIEGTNQVVARGTDKAGNVGTATLAVNLDTRAPELTITAPAANACISANEVVVTGRALDSHIDRVTVSGIQATLASDGTWTATLALPGEGRVVINVEATDGVQHLASATVPIVVDRTKPVVSVTSNGTAFTGGAFNRPVALFVRAADADPAATLTITLDGNPYVSGMAITAQGSHTLRASARDCSGNLSDEVTIAFTIDLTPLHVVAFDPAQGTTIGAPRAIAGTVDADDLKSATIEGTAFTAAISARTFTFANLPLAEGTNQFVVEVTDQAGNVAREPYSFRLKSTAPSVEILEGGAPIAAGALFNRAITPTIRSNEPGVTPVATLNGAPYALGTPIANDGAYTLTATATDTLGHASAPATATFSLDRTPPTVTINATVSGDLANVTGSVGGGDVTHVGVNNVVATVNGGSYAATVPLEIGVNTIVATAVDRAGNAASASIDVARDDNRPGLVITSPENGTTTNRPRTIVAGQLLTPGTGAHVTINGVEVTIDANGAFRKTDFPLAEGDNAITAAIVGTNRVVTVHVTADFTPPSLKVFAGTSEMTNGARYETSPQVTLQSDAATTKLSIDGNAVTGATPFLADGGHALTATARDAAGNETRADLTFFVGASASAAGCTLSNFDPPNNSAVFSDSVKISGLTGGATNVLVNGTPAQIAAGAFTASVALTQEGANTITITCTDATATLTIYRYTGAPSITIDPIAPPATGNTVTVTGTVGEGVVSGDVNGLGFTPAAGRYSVPNVSLNKGLNVVTARAKNGAGRIGVATAIVTLRGATPQISITSPLPSAQTGAASVDVTGTYADADPAQVTVTAAGSTYTPVTKPLGDTTGTFAVANVALPPNATTTITARAGLAQTSVDVQQLSGAPSVTIESPADNSFYRSDQQSAAVAGSISPIAGSVVQVNGVQASVDAAFRFTASVPLTATATPVVARVSTPDGTSASDSIRIVHFASPLTVVETFPAANATGVDIGAVLVVLFSNSLDASTARAAGALTLADEAAQTITGTAYVDKDAVSFAPNVPLTPGKRYTLTVSPALKDLAGGTLAAPFTLAFTTATGAPGVAPLVNESDKSGCLSRETITGRAATGSAKVRLDVDGVTTSTTAAGDGTFKFEITLSGRPGYHIARVREVGADGSLSPERAIVYTIDCAAPHVLGASLDRTAKKLTIDFSTSMNPATLIAAPGGTIILGALSGTVTLSASNRQATIAYDADLSTVTLTLTVKKEVKDAGGTPMAADFTQTFSLDSGPAREIGNGYIAGAVYDESTGRPLAGASVSIVPSAEPPAITAESGRYTRSLPEGAYTIEAGAAGFTTVWRQVVVAAGAGVVPIDIRLTRRGTSKPSGGALALSHASDAVTRAVDLAVPTAALGSGHTVTLTTVGAQSLAGLLPLGWSPLAAAEIVAGAPIPGSTLTFNLTDADVAAIAAANQTLSVAQYDPSRDEWRVVTAVATIDDKRVSTVITTPGNYALVYPDKATNLLHPPAPHAGAILAGVPNPCIAADACSMTKRSFAFDPPQVAPAQKAIATLITDGAAKPFPSGTAVQAYIDEQLNLSDGRVLFDPPFATDLLVYRNLAGTDGVAMFHVAPTSRAAQETLRDGVDHVRVVDYPGRIDRGTLLGAQGGRVPGDDSMSIDIPTGATLMELHASMTPMGAAELAPFVDHIAGFRVAGGFTFALTRSENAAPPPADLPPLPVSLLKPARGTFTVESSQQVVIAEVLPATPFGAMVRLAATTTAMGQGIFTTNPIDPAQLPVDGILRDGRYLILTADAPIAFAWGLLRNGASGPIIPNARITAPPLGVADLTRYTGIFAVPVPAKPAAPFSLRAATRASGEGTPAVSASSPDPGQNVRLDIVFDAQPPHLISITPTGEVDTAQPVLIRATFDADIDRATVAGGIVVSNLAGTVDAAGKVVTFTPTQPLQPGATYTIFVNPAIRAMNGAPLGQSASAQFRTRAIPSTANVDPKKIQITLPDNGVSIIRGTAGALPPGANALAVRRARNFVTQYQQTVSGDGSFSFAAGSGEAVDRITTTDLIDLQVIDAVSHAVIAVIPLTPFITAEGDGFLAPADRTTSFTTPAGIVITVPAGAFDEPTIVRANPVDKTPFAAVPTFDEELRFNGGVRIDFEGVAKQRLELDIPATTPLDPAKRYYLGRLIDTIRGPRIELDDTLRIDGTKLTTTLPTSGAGASRPVRALAIPGINTAGEVKQAMLGVVQRGDYGALDTIVPIGWAYTTGLGDGVDIFINTFRAIAISGFWLSQKSGKALIPVRGDLPFVMEGVDQATGVPVFTKPYDVQVSVGDPLSGTVVPSPQSPTRGPYPTFAALGRVEVIDVNAASFTDESRPGFIITFDTSGLLKVAPTSASSSVANRPLELLNVTTGAFQSVTSFASEVGVLAEKGDRVIIVAGAADADPLVSISFAFSEPLAIDDGSAASFFEVAFADTSQNITAEAKFTVDSANRRVTMSFPVGLHRGRRYRITMKSSITGLNPATNGALLGLGQVEDADANRHIPSRDLHIEFTTRGPGGEIGSFQIRNPIDPSAPPGTARDFALDGNILYVAGTSAGLLAYDVSDPAALTKPTSVPFAWAPVNPGVSDTWSVAADKHGRIWATGMTEAFGFIRAYTTDSFIDAAKGKDVSQCSTATPDQCPVPPLRGAMIVSYRPGFLEALPLSTYDSGITTTLTTKPESIPRKMQIVTQDDETSMTTAALTGTTGPPPAPIPGSDLFKITRSENFDPASKYWVQRVTFRNVTLGLQWSKDIVNGKSATFNLIGRSTDQWVRSVNMTTYGVVNLFGFGVGVYDLNALDSNRWMTPVADPAVYQPQLEQVLISDAKFQPECSPPDPTAPLPDPCNPTAAAAAGEHCPIPDLTFSPESIVLASAAKKFVIYGLNAQRGVVDFTINPPKVDLFTGFVVPPSCEKRTEGLTLASRVPWPSESSGLVPFDHPRLNTLRKLFIEAARKTNPDAPPPFARFSSMALYIRTIPATETTPASVTNYALIAGADYGLLVVKLDPSAPLDNNSLVDVVWVAAGAYAVRIVPGAQLATVTDGAGRILLVDLTGVDESGERMPLTASDCGSPDVCYAELFPSALQALNSSTAKPVPGQNWREVGADDSRIIWKSIADPNDLTRTTLAPVIDGETGILYKGDFLDPEVKIVAAADPRVRFLADLGNPTGLTEVISITPLGIKPSPTLLKCKPSLTCNASAAVFRLEVALPGAIAESLPGNELRVAVESETFPGVTAAQTTRGFPRAHLRAATSDGTPDPRSATEFKLRRIIPAVDDEEIQRLRYQKAFNHFQSPWVVAIADPRASAKYVWNTTDKAAKGCFSCDRPESLKTKREPDAFELYTAGRFVHVRPESFSSGGVYAYLGAKGRMESRAATIIADTIHPPDIAVAARNPPVAGGAMQETIYLHSGEVETSAVDFDAGGRAGWNVVVDRTYRSRTIGASPLGPGWDSSMFARLREMADGTIEYRDGSGEAWAFARVGTTNHFTASGLPLKLVSDGAGWRLVDQKAHYTYFDRYGRLMARSDHFANPLKVMSDNSEGNFVRYLYDEHGRLSQMIDPVNRVTTVKYYPETGLVKELTDWRQRKVTYEYDSAGRLRFGRLPEAANPAVPAFNLTGAKRPFFKYDYNAAITAPPPDSDAPSQQAYTDFLELAANVEAITDPAENAGANGGVARVKFVYDVGSNPEQRDRITSEKWPCANVIAGACAERAATLSYGANSGTAHVVDVMGQIRDYTLSSAFPDKRYHVRTVAVLDTPVIAEAAVTPLAAPTASLAPQSQTINTKYDYDEWGHITFVEAPEYQETNIYGRINTVHPGTVLKSSVAGSVTKVHTQYEYDGVAVAGVELSHVGREYGADPNASISDPAAFRATPRPHAARLNVERSEKHKQSGKGFKDVTSYDKSGLPLRSRTYQPDVSVPASGALPGGETRSEDSGLYPVTADQYARSRYQRVKRTDPTSTAAVDLEITYGPSAGGGEQEKTVDHARNDLTTTVTRDSMDRVVELNVSGALPVRETFGYDASGHLIYHSRTQKGLGEVMERSTVDPLGRTLTTSIDGANVAGVAGQTVETTNDYDLGGLTTTITHPPNAAGERARTVTTMDRLGRPSAEITTATGTAPVRRLFGYDIHGNLAYESDSLRAATLTQYDAIGRATRRIGSDGIYTVTGWTPWNEPFEERTFDGSTTLAYTAREFAKEGTPEHVNEVIDASVSAGTVRVRSTAHTWADGATRTGTVVGAATSVTTGPVPLPGTDLRAVDEERDLAGRIKGIDISSSDVSLSPRLFKTTHFKDFYGDLPQTTVDVQRQRGDATFTSNVSYDSLGNATTVDAAGGYRSKADFDQLGNRLEITPAGLGTESATFDSRGLQTTRTVPDPSGPKTIKFEYDALGGLTKYVDETGAANATTVERDALGRPTKTTYPDATFEQTAYEDGTGMVKATRDRAGQWLAYAYDSGGRVIGIHGGADLTAPLLVKYDYDLPGFRLHRISNVNAAVEFEAYDMLGRPGITRSIRYAAGGNLGNPGSLTIMDVHVQQHFYSVFGMERTRWRMPAVGHDVPASDPPSDWRSWIDEVRDGAGKIETITANGAFVIASSTSAGIGELATRTRTLSGTSTPLVAVYDYKDTASTVPFEFGGERMGPVDASGELRRMAERRGTATVAGTEVFRDFSSRVAAVRDLAFGERGSLFAYDDRGRLTNSKLHLSTADLMANPGTAESVTEADFRRARKPSFVFSAAQHETLGAAQALALEPPAWSETEKSAHRIDVRTILLDGVPQLSRLYEFTGGRRTSDGEWTSKYDHFGRLVQLEGGDRRIVAVYDPLNRLVGRTAYRLDGSNWVIEDRPDHLNVDGLPASTTLMWDPITDRLVAIATAGSSVGGSIVDPNAGLLRQYVHGDRGYDDPVEVLVADAVTGMPKRYLPVLDQAGSGSMESVVDGVTGNVVERVLYADAYGDAPRYLQGPVLDKMTMQVTKDGAGNLSEVTIRFHLTDTVQPLTAANGVRVVALKSDGTEAGPPAGTATVNSTDANTVVATLTAAQWQSLASATGAANLQIAVTDTLRTNAWGDVPFSPAPPWTRILHGASSTTALPVVVRQSLSGISSFIASAPLGATTSFPTMYSIPNLYLAGVEQSKTRLFTGFKAAPFVEPASGLLNFRNRWYDPSTGTYQTPDAHSYSAGSSNLYAGLGNDPVNNIDPDGNEPISASLVVAYLGNVAVQTGIDVAIDWAWHEGADWWNSTNTEFDWHDSLQTNFAVNLVSAGVGGKLKHLAKLRNPIVRKIATEGAEYAVDVAVTGTVDMYLHDQSAAEAYGTAAIGGAIGRGFGYGFRHVRDARFYRGRGDVKTSPWLRDRRPGVAEQIESFRGGGSFLIPESSYQAHMAGQTFIGRPGGQFLIPRRTMDELLAHAAGDLDFVKKRLGIPTAAWKGPMRRVDIAEPLLFNTRLATGLEPAANTLFRWGGYTSGGIPEGVFDVVPRSQIRSQRVWFKR